MGLIKNISDNTNSKSYSSKFRGKRYRLLLNLIASTKNSFPKILDIGGTNEYWSKYEVDIANWDITLINLQKEKNTLANLKSKVGDATNLHYLQNKSFDVVFSNSVIEHLYTKENQVKMANEVSRLGRNYFIQTPNRNFPFEPHFLFPFFQFLPNSIKLFLLRNFSMGHVGKIVDKDKAQDQINEIRLITKSEFRQMFPNATIYDERFLFFTKSFVAYSFDNVEL